MKTFRVKGILFAIYCGFIAIGHNYILDIWVIELRWMHPMINPWLLQMYKSKEKPTKRRIALCYAFSPLMMGFHWLVAVPVYFVLYAVVLAVLGSMFWLGWILVKLGDTLQKIGKL